MRNTKSKHKFGFGSISNNVACWIYEISSEIDLLIRSWGYMGTTIYLVYEFNIWLSLNITIEEMISLAFENVSYCKQIDDNLTINVTYENVVLTF